MLSSPALVDRVAAPKAYGDKTCACSNWKSAVSTSEGPQRLECGLAERNRRQVFYVDELGLEACSSARRSLRGSGQSFSF